VSESETGHRCGPNYEEAVCSEGRCCSLHEWCGSSTDHCTDNSLVQYSDGNCVTGGGVTCASESDYSHRCGPDYGDAVCNEGRCCSDHEWCGSSIDHCNANAYSAYSDGSTATCSDRRRLEGTSAAKGAPPEKQRVNAKTRPTKPPQKQHSSRSPPLALNASVGVEAPTSTNSSSATNYSAIRTAFRAAHRLD